MAIISRLNDYLRRFRESLLLRITLGILVLTALVILAQTYYPVHTTRQMIFGYKYTMLLSKAESIASSLNTGPSLTGEAAGEVVSVLGMGSVDRILITNPEAMVLFSSSAGATPEESYALFPEVISALEGNDAFRCQYTPEAFESYCAIPIIVGNVITG